MRHRALINRSAVGLVGMVMFLAGCTYAGMYTRFLVPRSAVTDSRTEVADLMDDTLKPFGFARAPSPLPGRFIYAGTEQRARNVTVVLDTEGSTAAMSLRVDLTIHVLDKSGSDSEIAKRVREAIQERFSAKYPVNLKFHTYRHWPVELGP